MSKNKIISDGTIRLGVGMWLNILIADCAEKTTQEFNQKLENKIQKEIEKSEQK